MKKDHPAVQNRKRDFDDLLHQEFETSERLRKGILIALLGLEGLTLLVLYLLYNHEYFRLFTSHLAIYAVLIFMTIMVIYELILHFYARYFRKRPERYSPISGYVNAFFEISLLSLLLLFIIRYSNQVIILHTPAALTYFIFIALSTLRLDYKLALFTGFLSAIEYIVISLVYYHYADLSEASGLLHTNIQILGQGLMLVIAGIASGFVASLINKKMLLSFYSVKEKNEVIDLFGQQISPQIAQEILKDTTGFTGRRKNVCIMFLDIRDFTSFSEFREPEEVVAYLNSLFGFMIEIVQRHNGIINQFLGDGFMATFGAPVDDNESCDNAVKASLEILRKKTDEVKHGNLPQTRIGIGLHYGEAVTGNIGSEMRKQYSITGSVVIIASRIETLSKRFRNELLVSEEVTENLSEKLRESFKALSKVKVKGSRKMISLYGIKNRNQKL